MKKAVSIALAALLVVGIVSFAVKIGHSPQPQGQFVVDDYTLALWHLNEGEGQTVHDESPHHNDGTLGPTSNEEDRDPSWAGGFTGVAGDYALSFDDWFDYVYVPDNPDDSLDLLDGDQFTIEFRTYVRQISRSDRGDGFHWNGFLNKGQGTKSGYVVGDCSLYPMFSGWFFNSSEVPFYTTCGPTSTFEWVHVMYTYDGRFARLYFNDVLQNETDVGHEYVAANDLPLTIGDDPTSDDPWTDAADCIVDEVRISSIARDRATIYISPLTITAAYDSDFTVDIKIADVTDLFAWQVKLKWNPELLTFVNATDTDFLETSLSEPVLNETEGWVFLYETASGSGVSGSGTLAEITFHGIGVGQCVLDIWDNETKIFNSAPILVSTPPYLGDANGDLRVNQLDIGIIGKAWGTHAGDPRYDPNADFNTDDFIDLFDLLCVGFNFNRIYSGEALQPVEMDHEVDDGYVIVASARVHNIDTGLNYVTIQEAIDAPESLDGHTLWVDAGTYYEHIIIHKSLSLVGEDRSTTIIDANLFGTVINVTAGNVKITGFTVRNSGSEQHGGRQPDCGIDVDEWSTGNNISHNIITKNLYGIWLYNSSDNIVFGNNIIANSFYGISLEWSSGNVISRNYLTANEDGINLASSPNNTITGNDITANPAHGIWLQISSNNTISGNNITESKDLGLELRASSNYNTMSGNNITNNYNGIVLEESSSNTISENSITANVWNGIEFYNSSNNNIYGNNIVNNEIGIWLSGASGNSVFRNDFIENTEQVSIQPEYPSTNTWDDDAEGNYWSDYKERYPNAEWSITGSPPWNGTPIWNTPYVIDEDNQDNYPLLFRWCREDVCRDGKINIVDISAVAKAYGSYPGHERWNPKADTNGDKEVNIIDITIVALKFARLAD
jgi:parallel beta-helix repeat protein